MPDIAGSSGEATNARSQDEGDLVFPPEDLDPLFDLARFIEHRTEPGEAKDIGLNVVMADAAVENAMWRLLEAYEVDLKLREPLDPMSAVATTDRYAEALTIAVVESTEMVFEFVGELEVRARRQMPPSLNVAMNLNLQLPPGSPRSSCPPKCRDCCSKCNKRCCSRRSSLFSRPSSLRLLSLGST